MKPILITGAAGFIGSNFSKELVKKNKYKIFILDNLTYAGSMENLSEISKDDYQFIKGSICDKELVEKIFKEFHFEKVIHFAAETHVDNSINSPDCFIKTNINGTFNLIQTAFNHWMKKPFEFHDEFKDSLFLHISTDEVFGSLEINDNPFTEKSPYLPNSPYSASKASSDLIVRSFNRTYGLNTIVTNCSNNFGKHQHVEKLIPKVIKNCCEKKEIPVYGDGLNIRDWISVNGHCKALVKILESDYYGESFCLGGDNEISNIELVKMICSQFNKLNPEFNHFDLINFVEDRPGHDRRYSINSQKYKELFKEDIDTNFETDLSETINWYISQFSS